MPVPLRIDGTKCSKDQREVLRQCKRLEREAAMKTKLWLCVNCWTQAKPYSHDRWTNPRCGICGNRTMMNEDPHILTAAK